MITGTGWQNTTDIVAGCSELDIAARICDDLDLNNQTDWFLPSKDELDLMWINLADSDGNNVNNGPTDPGNLGGFNSSNYWSSSEFSTWNAWYQGFSNGDQSHAFSKNLSFSVRAIREF